MQHKNAKVVQGSSYDVAGLTEILVFQNHQISDNNYTYYLPARNLGKEINIKLYKGIMMTLEELELLIKELREKGASENTEIKFINYAGSYGYDELTYSGIGLYFPKTNSNYIEMIFR